MMPSTQCPCCHHRIDDDAALIWNHEARTISGNGHAVRLTPMCATIFDRLWSNWKTGRLISLNEMMDFVYADDPDGGPENRNVISVQINNMNRALAPIGITIKGRHGYSLVVQPEAVAA